MLKFKKYSELILYFVFAYLLSWIILLPIANKSLSEFWHFAGAFGPSLAAILVVLYYNKIQTLLSTILKLPTIKSIAFGILPIFLGAVSYVICRFLGTEPNFDLSDFVMVVLPIITYGIFEEIGWRGFALPRLQEKFHPFAATLILTILWALWHIPFFGYRFDFSISMAIGFFITIFFGAVLLSSVYNFSNGALVTTILFHMTNNLVSITKDNLFMSIYSTLLIIIAVIVLIMTRGRLFYKNDHLKV